MAFNQSMESRISGPQDGAYGVPQTLYRGISHATDVGSSAHPLEKGELNFHEQAERMDMAMLRKTQGIHAPLRLMMERNAARKVERLPCLHSSRLQLDTLTRRSETIDVKDVLNNPFNAEHVGAPHLMMEKRLGLL